MHVGIVGGGISGLYSALLLHREGHHVTIFESTNRIGGRIYTHHFQKETPKEGASRRDVSEKSKYFEAGAMRIPRSSLHNQVYDLIRYLNSQSAPDDRVELIPYVLEHPNNTTFVQDRRTQIDDTTWGESFQLPSEFHGKSARTLLLEVVGPWLELLRKDFDAGFEEVLRYDELSFRNYLRAIVGWPHEVCEFVELMASQTNQYDLSFTEIIMQNLDFDTKEWVTVRGGMSRLTQCASNIVGHENIRLDAAVQVIEPLPDNKVQLTASGQEAQVFDSVVLAIPPAALSMIRDRPRWSFLKEQSLRGIHYEPLYKIGIHFKTRFWEHLPSNPSFGGQSATDLRFRWIVYPSNGLGRSESGVLLLYSWMTDALRLSSIPREKRVELALHDLSKFFADSNINVYEQFIEYFDVCWSSESATGDCMYLPGQFTRFHQIAKRPEGKIFFAGEHLSKHHTWIAGALDSALTTVRDVLDRPNVSALKREAPVTRPVPTEAQPREAAFRIPDNLNVDVILILIATMLVFVFLVFFGRTMQHGLHRR